MSIKEKNEKFIKDLKKNKKIIKDLNIDGDINTEDITEKLYIEIDQTQNVSKNKYCITYCNEELLSINEKENSLMQVKLDNLKKIVDIVLLINNMQNIHTQAKGIREKCDADSLRKLKQFVYEVPVINMNITKDTKPCSKGGKNFIEGITLPIPCADYPIKNSIKSCGAIKKHLNDKKLNELMQVGYILYEASKNLAKSNANTSVKDAIIEACNRSDSLNIEPTVAINLCSNVNTLFKDLNLWLALEKQVTQNKKVLNDDFHTVSIQDDNGNLIHGVLHGTLNEKHINKSSNKAVIKENDLKKFMEICFFADNMLKISNVAKKILETCDTNSLTELKSLVYKIPKSDTAITRKTKPCTKEGMKYLEDTLSKSITLPTPCADHPLTVKSSSCKVMSDYMTEHRINEYVEVGKQLYKAVNKILKDTYDTSMKNVVIKVCATDQSELCTDVNTLFEDLDNLAF